MQGHTVRRVCLVGIVDKSPKKKTQLTCFSKACRASRSLSRTCPGVSECARVRVCVCVCVCTDACVRVCVWASAVFLFW